MQSVRLALGASFVLWVAFYGDAFSQSSTGSEAVSEALGSSIISSGSVATVTKKTLTTATRDKGTGRFQLAEISQQLPSTDMESLASMLSRWSKASSFSVVQLDLESLEALRVSGDIVGKTEVLFDSIRFDLVDRRTSGDGRFVHLTLERELSAGVLTIDRTIRSVTGWINSGGEERIIIPVTDTKMKVIGGAHIILSMPTTIAADDLMGEQLDIDSRGKLPESSFATSSTGSPSLLAQFRKPPVREINRPLTIYAAYTRRAFREAQKNFRHPAHILLGETGNWERAFLRTGVRAKILFFDIERTEFREALTKDEESLQKVVERLESDPGEPAFREFRARRSALQADVGVLIVHRTDPTDCGHAGRVRKTARNAVFVVNWSCIRNHISGLHELGHVLGTHHETVAPESEGIPRSARAFVHDDGLKPFVTVTGRPQACKIAKCARAGQFSNPRDTYMSVQIGEPNRHDNAAVVAARLPHVVGFGESLASNGIPAEDPPEAGNTNDAEDVWSVDALEFQNRHSVLASAIQKVLRSRSARDADETKSIDVCELKNLLAVAGKFHEASRTIRSIAIETSDWEVDPIESAMRWWRRAETEHSLDSTNISEKTRDNLREEYYSKLLAWAAPSLGALRSEEYGSLADLRKRPTNGTYCRD